MPNVDNVKLGACSVTWKSTDLGFTKGGVEVEVSTAKKKIMVDQFGETDVNEYILGRSITVRIPLAESDLEILTNVIPGSTLVTDGTDANKKRIDIPSGAGTSLRSLAGVLSLHPYDQPASYVDEDVTIPLAAPSGDIQFSFRHDEEKVYSVEFTGYVDNATGLLYQIGDLTATP
jgi:hypothetical protein